MTKQTQANEDILEQLKQSFPTDPGMNKIFLPRISFVSQDKTEGKGKATKVVVEAGTFFTEVQLDEIDEETGKKAWEKTEVGTTMEAIILYQRKQLKYYDAATESFTSSPVYDDDNEIIPLFAMKKQVAKGTPEELKKAYQYADKTDGKIKSKLEDNRILYILYKGEIWQLNLRGSSMWSFRTYVKGTNPSTVLTKFGSEPKEQGSNSWNQMTFKPVRSLTAAEAKDILARVRTIQEDIQKEKAVYNTAQLASAKGDKELDDMAESAAKLLN